METLIQIARHSGDKKYLEPIPRALKYFASGCILPDGQVARYYELRTNRPVYMDRSYRLTYDDSALPEHYGWKHAHRFEQIRKAYALASNGQAPASASLPPDELEMNARRLLSELDNEGRWITMHAGERLVGQPPFERGFRYLSSDVFSRNIETLSACVAAGRR